MGLEKINPVKFDDVYAVDMVNGFTYIGKLTRREKEMTDLLENVAVVRTRTDVSEEMGPKKFIPPTPVVQQYRELYRVATVPHHQIKYQNVELLKIGKTSYEHVIMLHALAEAPLDAQTPSESQTGSK